ncbi:MAG: hypothetical protein ABIT08_03530 [Bacteroidia bacterium]
MKIQIVYFLVITGIFFSSCGKKSNTVSLNSDYAYFPVNVGHEIIYDVDSIYKSDFTHHTDTFHFQIKELIESTFTDNEGRQTLRLERYKRLNETHPWEIYKVWTANLTSTNAEKKEDNINFIKLVFSIALNKKWNGNAKNDLDDLEYKYSSANVKEQFNGFIFDSTLTVLQNDFDDTFTKKDFEVEKYSTGVGMFYKEKFIGQYKYPVDSLDPYSTYVSYKEKLIAFNN